MVKYKNGDVYQPYPCIKIITLHLQTLSVKWAAYRFFFLSGHKLFLNFRRTLNLRSLTRTWFLEKLDSNHCRELQGHRGNKRVNKRHGTRLDRKPFSPRRANEEASHLFVISDFFIKKKEEKMEEHFNCYVYISMQRFFFSD